MTAGSATGAHAAARAPIVTPACRRLGPVAGHDRDADPRSPDVAGEAPGHVDGRSHDERGSEASRGEHNREMVDRRRHPHDRAGRIEHAGREVGILTPCGHGAHERRRQPGDERGRRRRDEEGGRPPEPPPRPNPPRSQHRRADRDHGRRAARENDTRRGLDVELDHPARDSAAVQRQSAQAAARPAPPAPRISAVPRGRDRKHPQQLRGRPCCRPRSRPSSNVSVLAAPIAARRVGRPSATASAACLCGIVTLTPRKPAAGSARTVSANSSGGSGSRR